MCGGTAEVYASGASECYGYAWQTYGVECSNTKGQRCDMEVSIHADFWNLDIYDDFVIDLWNQVAKRNKIAVNPAK